MSLAKPFFAIGTLICVQTATAQEALAPATGEAAEKDLAEALPEHLVYMLEKRDSELVGQEQLIAADRLWDPGSTLKVCFFGGSAVVRTLIASVASEWSNYANLKFDFGTIGAFRDCQSPKSGFSQIRIGFGDRGYWSAVGRDSDQILNSLQPSMNFQGFDLRYNTAQASAAGVPYTNSNVVKNSRENDRGTILHEFGHAIGLLHEHQNPALDCTAEIDWPKAYSYYAGSPNFWEKTKVDRNIGPLNKKIDPGAEKGIPDPDSIMMYSQPHEIFFKGKDSKCYVQRRNAVSALDRSFVASRYPKDAPPVSDAVFETDLAPTAALVLAPLSGTIASADRLERVGADLSSEVVSIRREARRQLAIELQGSSASDLRSILENAATQSYRKQLGVLVAIDKAKDLPPLAGDDKTAVTKSLSTIESKSKDATLLGASKAARGKLGL